MSIQTTRGITRGEAIERITLVHTLARERKYWELEETTLESENELEPFVLSTYQHGRDIGNIHDWTDKMIEDLINQPFYRHSMFDNYKVEP